MKFVNSSVFLHGDSFATQLIAFRFIVSDISNLDAVKMPLTALKSGVACPFLLEAISRPISKTCNVS